MVRKIWVASTCPKELFSSAVTVAGVAVVSPPAAAYCCCCQSSRNACAVGSADSSEPKPVASPITSTPTAQEPLRGALRGQLRPETGSQPDDQPADRDDDDRGQLRPLRPPARGRGLLPGLTRRPRSAEHTS